MSVPKPHSELRSYIERGANRKYLAEFDSLEEQLEAALAALNCSHNNIPPDDPDNPWTYKEIDGKTYNYCPECGLAELWEGGQFFGIKLAGVSSPAKDLRGEWVEHEGQQWWVGRNEPPASNQESRPE